MQFFKFVGFVAESGSLGCAVIVIGIAGICVVIVAGTAVFGRTAAAAGRCLAGGKCGCIATAAG